MGSSILNGIIVLSIDNTGTLGTFTLINNTNGIEISATSPGDNNTTTGGYSSNVTFNNLFFESTF